LTFPAFVFGSFFAFLLGSLFHLFIGGDFKKLILYLITSWVGFWLGNFAGNQLGIQILKIGLINLGFAISGSMIFLAIIYWLGMDTAETNKKNP
jgi:hypothetical protein